MTYSKLTLPLQHVGNKRELIPRLQRHFPEHTTFVSVFGGSGAEILCKRPSKIEVFNDLNSNVVNVFRVLRIPSQRNELHQFLQMPCSSEEYIHCIDTLANPDATPVEKAYSFICTSALGYGSKDPSLRTPGSFAPSKARGRGLRRRQPLRYLERIANRFREVTLEHLDYKDLLKKYSRKTGVLFACDPPYHPETRSKGMLYKHDWGTKEHDEFLDCVLSLNQKVFICGYYNSLYNKRLQKWRIFEYPTNCTLSKEVGVDQSRVEVVWANW